MHGSTQDDHRRVAAGWQNCSVCLQQTNAKTPRSTRKRTGKLFFFALNYHLSASVVVNTARNPG